MECWNGTLQLRECWNGTLQLRECWNGTIQLYINVVTPELQLLYQQAIGHDSTLDCSVYLRKESQVGFAC